MSDKERLNYSKEQIDTIRYWQQQMQPKDLGGVGYEEFVEKHGPLFAAQVERMGGRLNKFNEQQGNKKLQTEDNFAVTYRDAHKDSFWSGEQESLGASAAKGFSRGAVGTFNFLIDAGREVTDLENYAKLTDFVGNKLLPGKPLALERWTEEMKAKALQREGGFGFYGRAIATPGDAKKYFDDSDFYEARPWLKMTKPFEGEDLGAIGTAAEIVANEIAFMGPLAFLRLAKAGRHVTHFSNVADKNYGRILTGKSYMKPMSALDLDKAAAGVHPTLSSRKARYVGEDAGRTHKQMSEALSESLGRKVSVRETKALQKLNARYGNDKDFFQTIKDAGDRGDVAWKNPLQKLSKTLNPKEARKIQRLVQTGSSKGRFLFRGSAGGAYKETELMASTAAVAGGAWVGEGLGEDFVVLGEVGGGLMGPSLFKNVGGAVPDAWNTMRYHFGTADIVTKEDTLLSAAFGKTKKQLEELKLDKNKGQREQLINMAKTLPAPKIPILFDFASGERKKLKAYRELTTQIQDLPADVQAEISARIARAEELLGENPDIYASLSAITGITVLETIEQSARAKDTLGKGVKINLSADQLKHVQRKIQTMEGLITRLEQFKYDKLGSDVSNNEHWKMLSNRIVDEVNSHLDDLEIVTNREIQLTADRLRNRTMQLIEENVNAQKLTDKDLELLGTATKDDYWKKKGVDELIDITDDGQMSTFSKNLQDDYNKFKNEQGAFIVADGTGDSRIMFNHGVSEKTLAENMKIHNDLLIRAYQDDKQAYKTLYEAIPGYSDRTLKVEGTDWMENVHNAILDNVDEMSGGIGRINQYPMLEKNLFPFIINARRTGLRNLGNKSEEALDTFLFEYQKTKKGFEDVTIEEIAENRQTLIDAYSKDISNTDIYDVLKQGKIKMPIELKGMVDARGMMYRMAHKHSVQNGGEGAMKGMYEYRIAQAINDSLDKIPGNKELKKAQKVYKERYANKWMEGLTYTMFGRALQQKDYDKLSEFDKFFKMNPVKAKEQFMKVYANEAGDVNQSAVELLKDSLARYYMQPDAKNLSREWFNSFGDILDLKPLTRADTDEIIPGSVQYSKGGLKGYKDSQAEFIADRNRIQTEAGTNLEALMKMVRTSAVRKDVFGDNIPLSTIERLSRETDPERFREFILNPSQEGGYENMAEAIIDVINRSDNPAEKVEATKSLKVVLWQGAMDKVITRNPELGFDSTQKAFKSGQDVNAAALDEFIATNKNVLKKIYSEKEFKDMQDLNEIIQLVAGQVTRPNVSGMPKPMTIPAVMSRVYGIFRGVISPKYVITELLYQDARFRRGKLLEDIATDPDAARIMADVVLYNQIKNRRVRSEFTRYWAGATQRFATDWYDDPVKPGIYAENTMHELWNEQSDDDYEWQDD